MILLMEIIAIFLRIIQNSSVIPACICTCVVDMPDDDLITRLNMQHICEGNLNPLSKLVLC